LADAAQQGQVYLRGADKPVVIRRPRDAVRNGIAFLTEDRKEQGLLLQLPVRVNISLTRLGETIGLAGSNSKWKAGAI